MENAISYFATVASLVLAVVAIWLSLHFYKQSNALTESTKEAAKEIKSGVERLEKLFDKLYEGTFSVMKDTVSDMRKHLWPEDAANSQEAQAEIDKKYEEKFNELRQEMSKEIDSLADRQIKADGNLEATKEELQRLVEKAIDSSIEVEREVREENIKEAILKTLAQNPSAPKALDLWLALKGKFSFDSIMDTLYALYKEGDITFNDAVPEDFERLKVGTLVNITNRGRRALSRSVASPDS